MRPVAARRRGPRVVRWVPTTSSSAISTPSGTRPILALICGIRSAGDTEHGVGDRLDAFGRRGIGHHLADGGLQRKRYPHHVAGDVDAAESRISRLDDPTCTV